jgi:SAM-dependent methyltransferase
MRVEGEVGMSDAVDIVTRQVPEDAARVLLFAADCGALAGALRAQGAREVVAVASTPGDPGAAPGPSGLPESPEIDFEPGAFDAIVCDQVLARVVDHAACLQRMAGWLRPGGTLVLHVPNLQYHKNVVNLLEGRWAYGDTEALDRRNLRFFTPFSLTQTVRGAGLEVRSTMIARMDDPAEVPRDAEGRIVFGRFRLGPFDEHGYNGYRARGILVVAERPAG